MTKKTRKGVHVTGKKGAYLIQPWIDHQPWCGCKRCAALPALERGLPHSFRIKRTSAFPDDFGESARYAREVKKQEEESLLAGASEWMAARPDAITIAQLARAYVEAHPDSERHASIIRCHLVPFFGLIAAANLKPADVRRYQRKRATDGVSPDTVDREWNALRAILNFAEAEERIHRNPIRRGAVPRIGAGESRKEFFEPEEWRAFLSTFDDEGAFMARLMREREAGPIRIVAGRTFGSGKRRPDSEATRLQFARFRELKPFFRGLFYGCARQGELSDLRGRHVDLRRDLVTLYQEKTRKPKTVPIAAPWRAELEAMPRGLPDAYVYRRESGTPIGDQEARRAFAMALDLADIRKDMTPHSIRHTVLSWLAMAGVSAAHRDEIAGHARTNVGDGYAHLTRDALIPVVALLVRIEAEGFTATERGPGVTYGE